MATFPTVAVSQNVQLQQIITTQNVIKEQGENDSYVNENININTKDISTNIVTVVQSLSTIAITLNNMLTQLQTITDNTSNLTTLAQIVSTLESNINDLSNRVDALENLETT